MAVQYVVLVRNPGNNTILAIQHEDGKLATWPTFEDAAHGVEDHILCQSWPYEIVRAP